MTNEVEKSVRSEVLNAFDTMWGLHPSPVLLLNAKRGIVAVNEAGIKVGIPLGIKCFQLTGKDRICDGCLGNEALRDHMGKRAGSWQDKMNMFSDSYWVPVKGQAGLFVHFGNDITEFVRKDLCC
jgi:hypothetical protein